MITVAYDYTRAGQFYTDTGVRDARLCQWCESEAIEEEPTCCSSMEMVRLLDRLAPGPCLTHNPKMVEGCPHCEWDDWRANIAKVDEKGPPLRLIDVEAGDTVVWSEGLGAPTGQEVTVKRTTPTRIVIEVDGTEVAFNRNNAYAPHQAKQIGSKGRWFSFVELPERNFS